MKLKTKLIIYFIMIFVFLTNNLFSAEKVFDFNDIIYNFEISPDEKYIAFLDNNNKLQIKELKTSHSIWKGKKFCTQFSWHPFQNTIVFAEKSNNKTSIIILNCDEKYSYQLLEKNKDILSLIFLPKGNLIGIIFLEGLPNSHGYTSSLTLLDQKGKVKKILNIQNINNFTVSPDEKFLAYSKYIADSWELSTIEVINLSTEDLIFSDTTNNSINPFFTLQKNNLIYCTLNNKQKIYMTNLNEGKKELLTEETDFSYIDNFYWLDSSQLLYSTGAFSNQLKILDIYSKEIYFIFEGINPIVQNKSIYFIKDNSLYKIKF